MIRFVVALTAEARPLIRRFALARSGAGELPVWRSERVALVVSGVGRRAAAAATAYLADVLGHGRAGWLNVGIGGHRTLPVGELVLADRVADPAGGLVWAAPRPLETSCATATVTTVDRPETDYPEETVYEMEAAGFCEAVARFTPAELIRVVKVISDNAAAPPVRLGAGRVERLIEQRIEAISDIAERTARLSR